MIAYVCGNMLLARKVWTIIVFFFYNTNWVRKPMKNRNSLSLRGKVLHFTTSGKKTSCAVQTDFVAIVAYISFGTRLPTEYNQSKDDTHAPCVVLE